MPRNGSLKIMNPSAHIWENVLVFPVMETRTVALLPICAIHSRSAEMEISRATITTDGKATKMLGLAYTRHTIMTTTISLSATGSRKAPKVDSCCIERAR